MKTRRPDPLLDDSRAYKHQRHAHEMHQNRRCTLCPPHAGENTTRFKRRAKQSRRRRR